MLPQLVFRRTVVGDQDASLLLLVYYFILFMLEDFFTEVSANFAMFTLQKIMHYRLDLVTKLAFLLTTLVILRTKISYPNVSNKKLYQQTNLYKLCREDL